MSQSKYQGRHKHPYVPWEVKTAQRVAAAVTLAVFVSVMGIANLVAPATNSGVYREVVAELPNVVYPQPPLVLHELPTTPCETPEPGEPTVIQQPLGEPGFHTELERRWRLIQDLQGQVLQMTAARDVMSNRAATAEARVTELEQLIVQLQTLITELEAQLAQPPEPVPTDTETPEPEPTDEEPEPTPTPEIIEPPQS